jgi:hypothetical protein
MPLSKWFGNLQLERRGSTLRMHSIYNVYPFGVFWIAILLASCVLGLFNGAVDPDSFDDILGIAILGFAGLVMLTIRAIDTRFDPINETILHQRALFFFVWLERRYALADTSGILFKPDADENDKHWLYLVIKDGRRILLAYASEPETVCVRTVEEIEAVTGLRRIADV